MGMIHTSYLSLLASTATPSRPKRRCLSAPGARSFPTVPMSVLLWISANTVSYVLKLCGAEKLCNRRHLELREKYGIAMDIYECYRQGCTIAKCTAFCCNIFCSFVMANTDLANALYKLAEQSETEELWELALEWSLKRLSLTFQMYDNLAVSVPFILIRLNRLDGACGFIQNYVAYKTNNNGATVSDWYECKGDAEARFGDSVALARLIERASSITARREECISMLVALLIIKMRIRHAAARFAWEKTLTDVFLRTGRGRELQPAFSALSEMFSLADDTVEQMDQIRDIA